MKILLTTDGSHEATAALITAYHLLNQTEIQATLLCVVQDRPTTRGTKAPAQEDQSKYREHLRRGAEKMLKQTQKILNAEGLETRAEVIFGSPAGAIVKAAENYDLTVVGGHSRQSPSHIGLGSVGRRVVEHAHSPILIVRGGIPERRLRILFGVDGSLASQRAMDRLRSFFRVEQADVTLMHIKETPWLHGGLDRDWFEVEGHEGTAISYWEDELQDEAEILIEEARDQLAQFDVTINTLIGEGNAATELSGEADKGQYDLVVVGATGARDVKHSMLGSVSSQLAASVPCSVFMVK